MEKEDVKKAINAIRAMADIIKEVREIPSGQLYAKLMANMSLDVYNRILAILKGAGLIEVDGFHIIRWIDGN